MQKKLVFVNNQKMMKKELLRDAEGGVPYKINTQKPDCKGGDSPPVQLYVLILPFLKK